MPAAHIASILHGVPILDKERRTTVPGSEASAHSIEYPKHIGVFRTSREEREEP